MQLHDLVTRDLVNARNIETKIQEFEDIDVQNSASVHRYQIESQIHSFRCSRKEQFYDFTKQRIKQTCALQKLCPNPEESGKKVCSSGSRMGLLIKSVCSGSVF